MRQRQTKTQIRLNITLQIQVDLLICPKKIKLRIKREPSMAEERNFYVVLCRILS